MDNAEKIKIRKRKDYHKERIVRKNFKETFSFLIFIVVGLVIVFLVLSASN